MEQHTLLLLRLAQSGLIDLLERHIDTSTETAKLLEARFPSLSAPADSVVAVDGSETTSVALPNAALPEQFREMDRALRQHGLSTQADKIVRLFGNEYRNATQTLEYVKSLPVGLEGDGIRGSGKAGSQDESSRAARDAVSRRKATVNTRMIDIMQQESEAAGWTSTQWASRLKCAKSTVVATMAWKRLENLRLQARAERVNDRRRNRIPISDNDSSDRTQRG